MHISVLQKEIIQILDPKPGDKFIDCTGGEGGHTLAILEKIIPEGKILTIDRDSRNVEVIRLKVKESRLENNLILINDNYLNLERIVSENNFDNISGIIFDLGFSSWHVDESTKGFSFRKNEILDMRYSNDGLSAWEIVNSWPPEELEIIFKNYGEERFSKSITKGIINQRKKEKIKTTFDLIEVIEKSVPSFYKRSRIHFATKVFQALRIATNDELETIKKTLPQALKLLKKGGKIAVISFHSLEDRIIKNFFKDNYNKEFLKIETKKPIIPSKEEQIKNPRSRSAKLRVATKI